MPKVRCPRPEHIDNTPSCEVYEKHGFCFVCNEVIPLKELGLDDKPKKQARVKENLEEKAKYIEGLPRDSFRGFIFPFDEKGFYIQYPNSLYYVHRLLSGSVRYKNPSGHDQPLFWASNIGSDGLFIVEGQINAMSIALVVNSDVCSPGGSSQFSSKNCKKYLPEFMRYNNIVVVTDPDTAGIKASIELVGLLRNKGPIVTHLFLDPDANEILQKHGKDRLKEEVRKGLQR